MNMAKNNQKNFITQQIQNNDIYWINHIDPNIIQNNTRRIVKEIVNGKYNYEKIGQYFLDVKFLDNLIIGLKNELEINTLYFNAVSFYKDNCCPNYPNIIIHINHLNGLIKIYSIILDRLYMVQEYNNIGYLSDLSAVLFQYKQFLN